MAHDRPRARGGVSAEEECSRLRAEVERQKLLIDKLADQLMDQQTMAHDKEHELHQKTIEYQQLQSRMRTIEKTAKDWERLRDLINRFNSGEMSLDKTLEEKDKLELQVDQLKQKIEDMRARERRLKDEPAQLQQTIDSMRNKLRERDEEIKTLAEFRKKEDMHIKTVQKLKASKKKAEDARNEAQTKMRELRHVILTKEGENNKLRKAKAKGDHAVLSAQEAERNKKLDNDRLTGDLQNAELMRSRFQEECNQLQAKYDKKCDEYDNDRRKFNRQHDLHQTLQQELALYKKKCKELSDKVDGHKPWGQLREIINDLHPTDNKLTAMEAEILELKKKIASKENTTRDKEREALQWRAQYEKQCSISDTISHQLQDEKRHIKIKEELAKAQAELEVQKGKVGELQSQVSRETTRRMQANVKMLEYQKKADTLDVTCKSLHNRLNEVQGERDQQKNVLELTHQEMAVVIASLKQMEAQVDHWKKNEKVRDECERLKSQLEMNKKITQEIQRQNESRMNRYREANQRLAEIQKDQLARNYQDRALTEDGSMSAAPLGGDDFADDQSLQRSHHSSLSNGRRRADPRGRIGGHRSGRDHGGFS